MSKEEIQPTPELKARFFAQYIGTRVRIPDGTVHTLTGIFKGKYIEHLNERWWFYMNDSKDLSLLVEYGILELKPISSITDEDAIEVAKMDLERDYEGKMNEYLIKHAKINVLDSLKYLYRDVSDYLRSKGYAIPLLGVSVETLIEWGWVRLASDTK